MEFTIFSPLSVSLIALVSGILFGFLLRKATVSRFDTIVGQLLLKDFTVMKVMLTAIVVGSIGIYSFNSFGEIPTFHLSKTPILLSIIGGCIFGVGMSVTGYCPGTAIAALAEGSKDMIIGLIGMLVGAFFYNMVSPSLAPYLKEKDIVFKETISSFFNFPNWGVILGIAVIWVIFVFLVNKVEKNQSV